MYSKSGASGLDLETRVDFEGHAAHPLRKLRQFSGNFIAPNREFSLRCSARVILDCSPWLTRV